MILIDACSNGIRSTDNNLVELLWHNGSVVAQSQTHQRAPSDRGQSTSGLTGEESAAWFPDTLDDALEKDLYTQLWHSIASATPDGGMFPGPGSHPPPDFAHPARPPMRSGIGSSWTGDICSTFCGSNQVPEVPVEGGEGNAALRSEVMRGASTHEGAGTSSSGGSGNNFGGSGLPSESAHAHKRKGRGRDDSDSRSEVFLGLVCSCCLVVT